MHFLGTDGALGGLLNNKQPSTQTEQQTTGRATITDIDAPDDVSVPVTG